MNDPDKSRSDDRREHTLPVTAEIGSEGGSYADSTMQVATSDGEEAVAPGGQEGTTSTAAGQAIHCESVAAGGPGDNPGPAGGFIRYPNEPPPSDRRPSRAKPWRAGLMGAAAGAATAVAAALIGRRR